MATVSSDQISDWDGVINTLARQRSRITGVELDDLIQEGRMSVLLCLLGSVQPTELEIKNSMRRWIRNQKKQTHTTYDVRTV